MNVQLVMNVGGRVDIDIGGMAPDPGECPITTTGPGLFGGNNVEEVDDDDAENNRQKPQVDL